MHVARTLLVSAVAHCGAFVVLARCSLDIEHSPFTPGKPSPTANDLIALEPMTIVPLEVMLLEESATLPAVGPARRAHVVHGSDLDRSSRREATTTATLGHDTAPGPDSPIDTRPNPLGMRGRRHDLRLSSDAAERIISAAADTGPEQPAEEPRWAHDPKIKLVPNGGGTHVVRDVTATFLVAPDGTLAVKHTPHVSIRLNLPTPRGIKKQFLRMKRELAAWAADPYRDTRVGSIQDLPRHLQAAPGACEGWGDPMCFTAEDQRKVWAAEDEALASKTGSLVEGKANISDYVMHKLVGDPWASRKLKILDQTRDERVRIGTEYRGEQLARSAELVQRNLEAMWRATTDPVQRRAALFAIWDECGEGEGSAGEAGERARAMVIGWIRGRLPEGTPDAFTAAEIEAFDTRRISRQRFRPYAAE